MFPAQLVRLFLHETDHATPVVNATIWTLIARLWFVRVSRSFGLGKHGQCSGSCWLDKDVPKITSTEMHSAVRHDFYIAARQARARSGDSTLFTIADATWRNIADPRAMVSWWADVTCFPELHFIFLARCLVEFFSR